MLLLLWGEWDEATGVRRRPDQIARASNRLVSGAGRVLLPPLSFRAVGAVYEPEDWLLGLDDPFPAGVTP